MMVIQVMVIVWMEGIMDHDIPMGVRGKGTKLILTYLLNHRAHRTMVGKLMVQPLGIQL
jgi:hypothetical protein